MNAAAAGFVMGLLGSAHCAAMCGGIAAALSAGGRSPQRAAVTPRVLVQNAGRVASYAAAGAIAGSVGAAFSGLGGSGGMFALRSLAALVMIAAGLQIGGWSTLVTRFESLGTLLWRRLAPLAGEARRSSSLAGAFVFGALWGWLPCGLVYSALVVAAAAGSGAGGAAVMAAFGLGTAPATVVIGAMAGGGFSLLRATNTRRFAGALVIVFAAWTFAAAANVYLQPATTHHCH